MDINIGIENEYKLDSLLKIIRLNINKKNSLLENLYLLIDVENALSINSLLVFVNLKLYLSKEELIELYKYIVYNELYVVLVDSKSYETPMILKINY